MASYPSEYARAREQRRRGQALMFAVLLLVFDVTLIPKGYWMAAVPVVVAFVFLAAGLAAWRRQDRPGSAAPRPRGWPAQVPAWLLRGHGMSLRGRGRDTVELNGRLHLQPGSLTWSPTTRSARLGVAPITPITWPLAGLRGVSVSPLWGIVPMCLLHFGQADGGEADIWLRAPSREVREALVETGVPVG